jgi:hypothetical protein
VREPVHLEEEQARHGRVDRRGAAARPALDDVAEEELVVVDGQQRAGRGGDDGQHDRGRDGRPERVDLQAGIDLRDQQDDPAVEHERAESESQDRDREQQPHGHRPDERVDEPDQGGRAKGRGEVLDVHVRQQRAREHQRRGAEDPHDDQPEQEPPAAARRLGRGVYAVLRAVRRRMLDRGGHRPAGVGSARAPLPAAAS